MKKDIESKLLSARFIVSAATAREAATVATDAFCAALQEAGLPSSPSFTALHIEEEREEAAATV